MKRVESTAVESPISYRLLTPDPDGSEVGPGGARYRVSAEVKDGVTCTVSPADVAAFLSEQAYAAAGLLALGAAAGRTVESNFEKSNFESEAAA